MNFGLYVVVFSTIATAAAQNVQVVSPYEGTKTIEGSVTGTPDHLLVEVRLKTNSKAGPASDPKTNQAADNRLLLQVVDCLKKTDGVPTTCLTGDTFTATLESKTAVGEEITVTAKDANGMDQGTPGQAEVLSAEYDWGRARAYFSGGTVVAKSKNEFSSPSIYLGLNVDYTWHQTDWMIPKAEECATQNIATPYKDSSTKKPKAPTADGLTNGKPEPGAKTQGCGGHFFNTYIETRLTQVPTISTGATPDLQITANSILQSPQSGYVEGGAYAPLFFQKTRWTYKRKDYALFVGPIAKIGFQSVRQDSIDGLTDAQAQAVMIGSQDVYRFIAAGARLGHIELPKRAGSSPRLLSYLDLTAGRWDNLRLVKPGVPPSGGSGFRYPIRFEAEGRLQVPNSPFFVGFTMNVGSGPDDMRFLFGTRFEIGQLLSWLTPGPH